MDRLMVRSRVILMESYNLIVMKRVLIVLLIQSSIAVGQDPDRDYRGFVLEFCTSIIEKEKINLSDAGYYFGPFSGELEFELLYQECLEDKSVDECKRSIDVAVQRPESYYSPIYFELRHQLFDILYSKETSDVISEINICDEGYKTRVIAEVLTYSGKWVFFQLNKYSDEPIYITDIFLGNGESAYNKILPENPDYLRMLGVINDPDGYTNLREGMGSDFKIVKKVLKNEVFYYTPNIKSNWWYVTSLEDCSIGYIHKSRISSILDVTPDDQLAEKIKEITSTSRVRCN